MPKKQPKKKTVKKAASKAKSREKTEKKTTARRKVKGADTDPRLANLIPFEPGQSGNPKGKKMGTRDRRTVIWEAMKVLAENAKAIRFSPAGIVIETPEDVEVAMQMSALIKAIKKGDFDMYKELSNGLYGKITDNLDIKSGGKSLADLIAQSNHAGRGGKRTKTTGKD